MNSGHGVHAIVTGLHHVTAFAGEAARNRRFYAETLGFPLVKRTVNFDSPSMWHLYYGQAGGLPGTLLTHFPEPRAARARHGGSGIERVTIGVEPGSLDLLRERLARAGIATHTRPVRGVAALQYDILEFEDPDGMLLAAEERTAPQQPGAAAEVARVTIVVPDADETAGFLASVMGFTERARGDGRRRLALGAGGSGREIDVVHAPGLAVEPMGAGSVHHVAWRVPDDDAQATAARALRAAGFAVTAVHDRSYFRSIYFRIPGGVLFEIATDGPGFAVDEHPAELGRTLQLPARYEANRRQIESTLPPLD